MGTNNSINLNAAGIAGYDGTSTFNGSTVTQHSILLGGANNHTINNLGVASNGQLPIGSSTADPVLATLTPGAGISITNGAGSITIAGSGGGFTWTDVTSGSQTVAAQNGYTANKSTLTTFTLPTNNALGDTIIIMGKGTGGWKIVYTTNQFINFGITTSTTTTGSLASTQQFDCVTLVCTVASASAPIFTVLNSVGNLTVV